MALKASEEQTCTWKQLRVESNLDYTCLTHSILSDLSFKARCKDPHFSQVKERRGKKKGASVGGSSMLETLSSTSDVWVMWQKEEIPAGSPAGRCLRRAAPVHESDHDCKWSFASFSNKVRHTSQETQCPCHLKKKKERKVQSKSPDLWGAYMRTKK